MRESMATKPIYIYAPDINMLTNVFCFGCLYFIESDTGTTDES